MSEAKGKKNSLLPRIMVIIFLVVIILLGVIILIPHFWGCNNVGGPSSGSKARIAQLSSNLKLYKSDNQEYPTTAEGLLALVSNPGGENNWRQLLPNIDKDPWGNDYQYQFPGIKNPSSFDLWSFGADGKLGGEGANADVTNWDVADCS